MSAKNTSPQKDSVNEPGPNQGFVTSSNEATGRPSHMQPRWKLAGIDAEGAHHVLQDDDNIIYVIQNGCVEEKQELGDYQNGLTLARWRAYVADTRGWDVFFLKLIDLSGAFDGMGDRQ